MTQFKQRTTFCSATIDPIRIVLRTHVCLINPTLVVVETTIIKEPFFIAHIFITAVFIKGH